MRVALLRPWTTLGALAWHLHRLTWMATAVAGWQWMFLLQGIPTVVLGGLAIFLLSDSFANAKWMQMSHQHTSWVRESYLYGSEQSPWVKAKSIFPILSLQKKARIFQHIGTKPIGWFLFQRTNPLCQRRVVLLDEGWTRQSCYTWHGCKFIVQETFLPAFEHFIQNSRA